MARKFLYCIAAIVVLFIAGAFVLRIYGPQLAEVVFVPETPFERQELLETNIYDDVAMWFARPEITRNNPANWLPEGLDEEIGSETVVPKAATFFLHPTSYLTREHWNAPLDDKESQDRARLFLRGQASVFNGVSEIWAPRYRQATLGAFLTDKEEGKLALDAAYQDVLVAFDYFIRTIDADQPIILAGHSQGSLHLTNLLKDRVAGTPLSKRIIAAYVVGWPVSRDADVPALGLDICESPEQAGCLLSWESFAEPADYSDILKAYDSTIGFTGLPREGTRLVCSNPINGDIDSEASGTKNLGTLVPNADLTGGALMKAAIPARCDDRGFLLIGDPPDLGPYTLPGNNYHVYDYSLFWSNLRADVKRRTTTFLAR